MNDFDDELRRLLRDDRLALTPGTDAVGRIVKGAHRRRTIRLVASAAGSVGLVAAVAFGSIAVAGQFSAGPSHEPLPAVTPTLLPGPQLTPGPDASPVSDPVVLDPDVGIDGFTVGTKLADLEEIDGVELTPYGPDRGISEMCYGEYASANAHGTVSVRGSWGDYPDDPMPYYEVATMHLDVPFVTPAGIGVGSTEADVFEAYPGASWYQTGDLGVDLYDDTGRSWVFAVVDGLVTQAVLDGVDRCSDPAGGVNLPDGPQYTGGPEEWEPGGFRVNGDEAFAPAWLGMTIDELDQLPGVRIRLVPGENGVCYGQFEYQHLMGLISVRSDFGEAAPPTQSTDDYRVTYIASTADASTTPLGLGPGSTLDMVRQAYPDLVEGEAVNPYVTDPSNPAVRWVFNVDVNGVVAGIAVDAGQNCAG